MTTGGRLGKQDVAPLAAFPVPDRDPHPAAVVTGELEADRLGGAQPRRVGGRQRGTRLQARYRLEKPYDLVGAQHQRQLARLSCVWDALGDLAVDQRDTIEKPQRANRLGQAPARDDVPYQMN